MVRVRDSYGVEAHGLRIGQPLEVIVGLAPRPYTEGTIQYRILTTEGECAHESKIQDVDMSEGPTCRWSQGGLDVSPGAYILEMVLSIGEDRFESRHHLEAREAGSAEDPGSAYLSPWEKWYPLPEAPEEAGDEPGIVAVEVVRKGREDGPILPGTVLVARMYIAGLGKGLAGLHCRTWITGEDGVVGSASATGHVASPSGALRLDQHLQLNLLDGTYHMHCAVWDLVEDRAKEPVWSFPLVIGGLGRHAGGGMVYSPHTLTAEEA
jgi:hypothetical protein